jgi:DNA-binding NarL/FixJ family response regulator
LRALLVRTGHPLRPDECIEIGSRDAARGMRAPRVLIGDDHALLRAAVASLLGDQYDVIGEADNGQALVRAALQLKPDLVVLDVSMPVMNGIDAAAQIVKNLPATQVVFLSMHASPLYMRSAMAIGARAYVLKSAAPEELLQALAAVRRGQTYVSPDFGTDAVREARMTTTGSARAPIGLTTRQRQILQMVAEGRQNKEIAATLGVSVKTVEFHRARLMTKLNARSVAELTRYAIREGLIHADAT